MEGLKRILVLGNFGYANHNLNGQTVKTRVTRELAEKYYTAGEIDYFDTQTLCKKSNIFRLLKKVIRSDKIIYLPAHGNLKYLFPVYFIMSYIFRFDIIYSVIGGWLVPYLKKKPIHRWMLCRIKVVLAETQKMKQELESEYGFQNVSLLYNFRITDFKPEIKNHKPLKLVFMARMLPQKGLDTIFNFCKYISSLHERPDISIDFYGPITIEDRYLIEKEFDKYEFCIYHGELEPEKIYSTLSDYDIVLLPTHFYTEGLPGTIIDSYLSGLPVIATDWLHAREFIDNGVSGIIVPFDNPQSDFNNAIMHLYKDRDALDNLKSGAILKGNIFKEQKAWDTLRRFI